MIKITPNKTFREILKVGKQWPERTAALRRATAYEAARKTQAGLLEKIPSGKEWDSYREALTVSEVALGGAADAFALRAVPRARELDKSDEDSAVIYVRANKMMQSADPKVQVLEKYGPWTLDTIPYTPTSKQAKVFFRQADKSTVAKVRRKVVQDRRLWRKELNALGVRVPLVRPSQVNLPKAVPEMAYAAFNLEFGRGVKPEPHWRPTLRELTTAGMKRLSRNPKVLRLFTQPAFTGWTRWQGINTSVTLRPSQARKYIPFQRKLGVKA